MVPAQNQTCIETQIHICVSDTNRHKKPNETTCVFQALKLLNFDFVSWNALHISNIRQIQWTNQKLTSRNLLRDVQIVLRESVQYFEHFSGIGISSHWDSISFYHLTKSWTSVNVHTLTGNSQGTQSSCTDVMHGTFTCPNPAFWTHDWAHRLTGNRPAVHSTGSNMDTMHGSFTWPHPASCILDSRLNTQVDRGNLQAVQTRPMS